jgi:8-oxo-dGTP pyrophosphatase MutT (NUDIX family)
MTELPPYVEARVRAGSAWEPPIAVPAATVVLLRERDDALETYLMRRTLTMAFAPGMYVFPGGRVEEQDFQEPAPLDIDPSRMSADRSLAGALVNCAVRELAEETGISLGFPLPAREFSLIDHWVTPEVEERRYDVRFFACVLPADQAPRLLGTEADRSMWMSPSVAIQGFQAGDIPMLPPTIAVLAALSEFDSAERAMSELAQRPVQPLLPRPLIDESDRICWSLVNDRTGVVVRAAHEMPHAWEARGVRG